MDYLALILAVGFAAFVVWIVLRLSRRDSNKPHPVSSDSAKGEDSAEGKHFTEQYLQESIRLAELYIDQLDLAKSDLDKKGQWLAAFCIAILGFVLNQLKESASSEEMILYLLTIPFPLAGFIYAALSLNIKFYGPKGLPPEIAIGKFKDITSEERMKSLLYYTLTGYHSKIDTSMNSNNEKIDHIKKSLKSIAIGAGFLILAYSFPLSFPLFVKTSSQIQAWVCL